MNNEPALELCRKLGFVETGPPESASVELRWMPPRADARPAPAAAAGTPPASRGRPGIASIVGVMPDIVWQNPRHRRAESPTSSAKSARSSTIADVR